MFLDRIDERDVVAAVLDSSALNAVLILSTGKIACLLLQYQDIRQICLILNMLSGAPRPIMGELRFRCQLFWLGASRLANKTAEAEPVAC